MAVFRFWNTLLSRRVLKSIVNRLQGKLAGD